MITCRASPSSVLICTEARPASTTSSESRIRSRSSTICSCERRSRAPAGCWISRAVPVRSPSVSHRTSPEVWAVDQEPETIEFARTKARARGVDNVRWIVGRAEDVDADSSFELVTIGNAFHRLQRRVIAASATRWLVPGGHVALLWSNSPSDGSRAWQRVTEDTMRDWTRIAATAARLPENLAQHLAEEPDAAVLAAAGLTIVGQFEFEMPHAWSLETLTGFMYSTSILSHQALGRNAEAFARDLRTPAPRSRAGRGVPRDDQLQLHAREKRSDGLSEAFRVFEPGKMTDARQDLDRAFGNAAASESIAHGGRDRARRARSASERLYPGTGRRDRSRPTFSSRR